MALEIACSLTNIQVKEGTKVQFIPLIKETNEWRNNGVTPSRMVYSTDMFRPFTFPIEGIYDGYGALKDIVKTKHTEIIESVFGLSIENFVKVTASDDSLDEALREVGVELKDLKKEQREKVNTFLSGISGMFILDEFYQKFVINKIDKNHHYYTDIHKQLVDAISLEKETILKVKENIEKYNITNKEEVLEEYEYEFERLYAKIKRNCHLARIVIENKFDSECFRNIYGHQFIYLPDEFIALQELYSFMHYQGKHFSPSYRGEGNILKQIEFHEEILNFLEMKKQTEERWNV